MGGHTASALGAVVGSVPALDAADAPILGWAPIAACAGGDRGCSLKHSHASWLPSGSTMLCICKTMFIPEH